MGKVAEIVKHINQTF